MPKLRTHKGTQKRFRLTATGKVMRRHAMRSHLLEKKSPKRKRANRQEHELAHADVAGIKKQAPYL